MLVMVFFIFDNTHGLSFQFYPYNVILDLYTTLNPKTFSCHKGMMIEISIAMGAKQLKFFDRHPHVAIEFGHHLMAPIKFDHHETMAMYFDHRKWIC
jgi:hypothetical protein